MIEFILYDKNINTIYSTLGVALLILEFTKYLFYMSATDNTSLLKDGKKGFISWIISYGLAFSVLNLIGKNTIITIIFFIIFIIITFFSIFNILKNSSNKSYNIIYIYAGLFFLILTSGELTQAYISLGKSFNLLQYYNDLIFILYIYIRFIGLIIFLLTYGMILFSDIIEIFRIGVLFGSGIYDFIRRKLLPLLLNKKEKNSKEKIENGKIVMIDNRIKMFNKNILQKLGIISRIACLISLLLLCIVINSGEYTFNEDLIEVYELIIFSTIIPIISSFINLKKSD